jgi:hypothetical protein
MKNLPFVNFSLFIFIFKKVTVSPVCTASFSLLMEKPEFKVAN